MNKLKIFQGSLMKEAVAIIFSIISIVKKQLHNNSKWRDTALGIDSSLLVKSD